MYCLPHRSQVAETEAAPNWHGWLQYSGLPGCTRQIVDRALVNTVPHPAHSTGTAVGSDKSFPGAQVSGSDVGAVHCGTPGRACR